MEKVLEVLRNCLKDPKYLAKGDELLQDFDKKKGFALGLLKIASSSNKEEIKVLASILLKNFVLEAWETLPSAEQAELRAALGACVVANEGRIRGFLVRDR